MSILTQNNPYVPRFEDMLKPLQSKLSKLETKLNSIDDDHPHKQQSRLNVLEEISKTKQEIENTLKNLECSKTMNVIRSDKVPSEIQDHNVWNDCWYDEERRLYVTFNSYFANFEDVWNRYHQKQYTEETGIKAVIILSEQIEFRFGYPTIIQKNSENQEVLFLLPMLTNDMLTDDIVMSRIKPESQEDAVLYRTVAERWITVGTDGFSMCEKENEISDKFGVFPSVPLEELKTLYKRT